MKALGSLVLVLLAACTTVAPPAQPPLAADLQHLLARYYPADRPGAAVLVVRDGQVLLRNGYGLADMELKTPIRPEMLFRIGSITKQFTAAAVLDLIEQKKLSLDTRIGSVLDGFSAPAAAITVEQLLSHTSGIGEYTEVQEYRPQLRQDANPEDILDLIRQRPLEFSPGTRYRYTNTAYFILGAMVEKTTGIGLAQHLRYTVLDPHGLTNTRHDSLTEIIPNRVRGYERGPGGLRNATLYSPTRAYAIGDLLSNVDDLHRWNELVIGGKVLPASLQERALTPGQGNYGFGWFINTLEGERVIEHGGDIPGFSAHVLTIPSRRIFVAVLSNDASHEPRADFVAAQLATFVLGKPYDPRPVTVTDAELDALAGTYVNADGVERLVFRENAKFYIQPVGGRRSEVLPLGGNRFFYPNTFLTAEFRDSVLILRHRGEEQDRATRKK
jgi:D-alanyl-D-alanine carboxypeptidase